VLKLSGIAVDVDNPSDLQDLISLPGETRAQALARKYANMASAASALQPRRGAQ
jgi:2-phospho-L-lactate guanylyltransferase (CobY/MobA/RfbA family)